MADTETKVKIEDTDPQSVQDLTGFVPFGTNLASANARQVSADVRPDHHKKVLDDMSTRIDDLEKNIGDLMNQAGVDEPEK